MDNRTLFQVDLGNFQMTDDQIRELESRITQVTIEYLNSYPQGKELLKDAVAYKPNPDDPFPLPWPWPFPRPWPWPFPGFFPINRRRLDAAFKDVKKLL